jgi:hypothetical protein
MLKLFKGRKIHKPCIPSETMGTRCLFFILYLSFQFKRLFGLHRIKSEMQLWITENVNFNYSGHLGAIVYFIVCLFSEHLGSLVTCHYYSMPPPLQKRCDLKNVSTSWTFIKKTLFFHCFPCYKWRWVPTKFFLVTLIYQSQITESIQK